MKSQKQKRLQIRLSLSLGPEDIWYARLYAELMALPKNDLASEQRRLLLSILFQYCQANDPKSGSVFAQPISSTLDSSSRFDTSNHSQFQNNHKSEISSVSVLDATLPTASRNATALPTQRIEKIQTSEAEEEVETLSNRMISSQGFQPE